jgi:transposase
MTWTVAAPPERVILSICEERRAAMELYAGLEVSLKRTEICVVDGAGGIVWRGCTDTHPERIADALCRWRVELVKVGLETGSTTPWLARGLRAPGVPVVVMEARRAADALKGRPVKADRADARALAEMLQTNGH